MTITQLNELIAAEEGEYLEFKEAKTHFHFDKLCKYCSALAGVLDTFLTADIMLWLGKRAFIPEERVWIEKLIKPCY